MTFKRLVAMEKFLFQTTRFVENRQGSERKKIFYNVIWFCIFLKASTLDSNARRRLYNKIKRIIV